MKEIFRLIKPGKRKFAFLNWETCDRTNLRSKNFYFFVLLIFWTFQTQAQTVITINGATNGSSTLFLNSGTNLYVQGGITVNQNGSATVDSNDYLQNNGTIQLVSDGVSGQSNFTNNVPGLKIYSTGQTTGQVLFAANGETQTISGGGTVEFMNLTTNNTSSPILNLQENISADGVFTLGGATCNINSNTLTLNGNYSSTSGTLTGSSASNLAVTGSGNLGSALNFASGAQTLKNLTVNRTNSSGQTMLLGSPLSVGGTLTISNGILDLQGNNLTLPSTGALAGSPFSSGNMIQADGAGQFILGIGSGAGSFVFPVGDGTPNYSPVSLTFSANSAVGTLGVNVVNSTEPNMDNPSTPASYLTRYWTFGNNTLGNYSFTGSLGYPLSNVIGSQSNMQLSAWNGTAWMPYYGSSASAGTLTFTTSLNQGSAPLTGDFTGREGTPNAYAVTGGTNCASTTVGVASSQFGVSYKLYLNAVATGSPVAGTGSAVTFGAQTATGNYTVVGTDGNGNTTQMTGSATVNFIPTVSSVTSQTLCNGSSTIEIDFSGTATTYSWANTNATIGLAASGTGNIDAFASVNTTSSNVSGTITVTPQTAFCTGTSTNFSITVLPTPVVAVTPSEAICTGSTTATLVASGAVSYTWAPASYLNVTTGTTVTASISLLTFYTVTGTGANSCTANSAAVPVATVPSGGTVLPVSTMICSGGTQVLTASGVAGHDYQWQESVNNVYWTNISGATNTTYTTASADGATKKYYRIVANSNACWDIASTTAIVDISVTPEVSFTAVTSTTATVTWTPFGSGQYNISWMGTAGTGSASALTTNIYTITGLAPNASLLVTVTPTVTCSGSAQPSSASTNTLCAVPGSVTVTAAAAPAKAFKVTWAAVNGATAYVVYYRNLLTSSYWSTVDTSGTQKTVVVPYAGATYAVYVAAYGCPASGDIGDGSAVSYVTTNPLPEACISIPDVTATSGCPNQITVGITGGSGSYELTLRRLSPSLTAGVTYAISGSTVNITVGTQFAGTVWEVFARNVCSAGNNSAISGISIVTVKPGCPTINNLVLSHVSCSGFIASWNTDNCAGEGITAYQLLIKPNNELNYDGYSFSNLTDYAGVDWLNQSRTYNVEIRSISCNGATSAISAADTITLLGCREEEQSAEDVIVKSASSEQEAVTVYPNPTDGYFFVDIGRTDMGNNEVKIELVNVLGEVVQTNLSTISEGHLNQLVNIPAGFSSGIYLVRTSVGGNTYVNRLVLSRY